MTDTALLYLLAGLLLAAPALLLALLLRRPEAALERLRARLEEALRDEQRDGRLELRQQLDGLAATREIRAWEEHRRAPRTPIVAVTAHALAGEEEKVRAAGMDAFLPKPVRLEALRTLLIKWTQASASD